MIPTMRSVIDRFGGCTPALEWATDMDVQKGWEVCVEPGWLMLLAFNTQKDKDAVGFKKSAECTYECIKPGFQFTSDQKLLDIAELAFNYTQTLDEKMVPELQAGRDYALQEVRRIHDDMKALAAIGHLDQLAAVAYCATCAVNQFTFGMLRRTELRVSARLANSSIDSVVLAFTCDKFPDAFAIPMGLKQTTPQEEINKFKLEKSIEICRILRNIIPMPFLKYD